MIKPKEILDLIKKLPESDMHIYQSDELYNVTNEWLVGAFAGRGFEDKSYEKAAQQLIDYLYEHIGHNSIVGKEVTKSGFPDLNKVYEYCKPKIILENDKN